MWKTVGERTGRRETSRDVLDFGVPNHLVMSLMGWVNEAIQKTPSPNPNQGYLDTRDVLLDLERTCRMTLDWQEGARSAERSLHQLVHKDSQAYIDAVDRLVSHFSRYNAAPEALEVILEAGGSAWRVTELDGRCRLIERVDATVDAAAHAAMDQSGKAGQYLASAWVAMYGRQSDPGRAYKDAVRAVEASATPILAPQDPQPTLGKMIAHLRDTADSWTIPIAGTVVEPIQVVISMMQLLWHGQFDRHGSIDDDAPLDVSLEEAETAVHLATTLVHWFSSGLVTPKQ